MPALKHGMNRAQIRDACKGFHLDPPGCSNSTSADQPTTSSNPPVSGAMLPVAEPVAHVDAAKVQELFEAVKPDLVRGADQFCVIVNNIQRVMVSAA
jgi:hypothetical protein